jgi:heptosyltransferase-1
VVEEAFAELPCLHPAIERVIPVALRRWRKRPLSPQTWYQMAEFRRKLQATPYDLVIDTQGLLKSALLVWVSGRPGAGFAADSAREPAAARYYRHAYAVDRNLHAVTRNRQLSAQALGFATDTAVDYGIAQRFAAAGSPHPAVAVLLTATSRDDKLWPEAAWVELGRYLAGQGLRCLLPAGSARERERAGRIAALIPDAELVPPADLAALAEALAQARIVVGVDTGLVHLAAALGRPTIALFAASDPGLTGVLADVSTSVAAQNLGRRGAPPTAAEVIAAVGNLL